MRCSAWSWSILGSTQEQWISFISHYETEKLSLRQRRRKKGYRTSRAPVEAGGAGALARERGRPPAYVTRTTHWGISLDARWPTHRGVDLHSSTSRGGPAKSGPPAGPVSGPCAGPGFTSGSVEVHTPPPHFQGSRRKIAHAILPGTATRALSLDRRDHSGHLHRTRPTLHEKGSRIPSERRKSLLPWLLNPGKLARGR